MRVLREKLGANGDLLVFSVERMPRWTEHDCYKFRTTRRAAGECAESVLLSEGFYIIARFATDSEIEALLDDIKEEFECAFEDEAARMDADDAADAIDKLLSKHDTNTNS